MDCGKETRQEWITENGVERVIMDESRADVCAVAETCGKGSG